MLFDRQFHHFSIILEFHQEDVFSRMPLASIDGLSRYGCL
jgi:hypothetical protein